MPLIGVVNSWGENNPGAKHIDTLAKMAKAGIEAAGGGADGILHQLPLCGDGHRGPRGPLLPGLPAYCYCLYRNNGGEGESGLLHLL